RSRNLAPRTRRETRDRHRKPRDASPPRGQTGFARAPQLEVRAQPQAEQADMEHSTGPHRLDRPTRARGLPGSLSQIAKPQASATSKVPSGISIINPSEKTGM